MIYAATGIVVEREPSDDDYKQIYTLAKQFAFIDASDDARLMSSMAAPCGKPCARLWVGRWGESLGRRWPDENLRSDPILSRAPGTYVTWECANWLIESGRNPAAEAIIKRDIEEEFARDESVASSRKRRRITFASLPARRWRDHENEQVRKLWVEANNARRPSPLRLGLPRQHAPRSNRGWTIKQSINGFAIHNETGATHGSPAKIDGKLTSGRWTIVMSYR